eukprot:FR737705.1.p1 GENE.FR737705.1~~FR737705.1.p1  ORF type:complete len:292 (+),score=7.87 FR737705.1:111-878(+)
MVKQPGDRYYRYVVRARPDYAFSNLTARAVHQAIHRPQVETLHTGTAMPQVWISGDWFAVMTGGTAAQAYANIWSRFLGEDCLDLNQSVVAGCGTPGLTSVFGRGILKQAHSPECLIAKDLTSRGVAFNWNCSFVTKLVRPMASMEDQRETVPASPVLRRSVCPPTGPHRESKMFRRKDPKLWSRTKLEPAQTKGTNSLPEASIHAKTSIPPATGRLIDRLEGANDPRQGGGGVHTYDPVGGNDRRVYLLYTLLS